MQLSNKRFKNVAMYVPVSDCSNKGSAVLQYMLISEKGGEETKMATVQDEFLPLSGSLYIP